MVDGVGGVGRWPWWWGCGKRGRDDESDGVWGGEIRPRGAACGRARNRDRRDAVMHYLPLSFMAMRGVGRVRVRRGAYSGRTAFRGDDLRWVGGRGWVFT